MKKLFCLYALLFNLCAISVATYAMQPCAERILFPEITSEEAKQWLTPLHIAARDGNLDQLKGLLAAGARKNDTDRAGNTPLHYAAEQGKVDCMLLLIALGAKIASRNIQGSTPLHCAVAHGNTECTQALIAAGADIESQDLDGETPLHYAADSGQVACLKILTAAGANPEARDERGKTALHKAAWGDQFDSIDALIEMDANTQALYGPGRTPLDCAIIAGNFPSIRRLVAYYQNYCPPQDCFKKAARKLKMVLLSLRYAHTDDKTPKKIHLAGNQIVMNDHLKVEIFKWLREDLATVFLYLLAKRKNIEFPLFTVEETREIVIAYLLSKISAECLKIGESRKLRELIENLTAKDQMKVRSLFELSSVEANYGRFVTANIKKRILELRN